MSTIIETPKQTEEYKREAEIIKRLIDDYQLYATDTISITPETKQEQPPQPPQPPAPKKWYLYKDNQQTGPFSEDQLLTQGVTPQTYIWCAGMEGWKIASEVTELEHLF